MSKRNEFEIWEGLKNVEIIAAMVADVIESVSDEANLGRISLWRQLECG